MALGGLILGLFLALWLGQSIFRAIDTRLQDFWVRVRIAAGSPTKHPWVSKLRPLLPAEAPNPGIVLVLLDEQTYLGMPEPTPWHRERVWANGLRYISQGKPRAIGVDVFFAQNAAYDPRQDQAIADACREAGNVVMMGYRRGNQTMSPPFPLLAQNSLVAPPYFYPYIDESVRKSSLVFRPVEGDPLPSFPTELARLFLGLSRDRIEYRPDEVVFHTASGPRSIPIVDGENILINYTGFMTSIPMFSFFDIYHRRLDPAIFRDQVVIIGWATSMVEDRFLTPTGRPEYGALIHAQTLQNILTGTWLRPPPDWWKHLLCLVSLAVSLALARVLYPLPYAGATIAGSLLIVAASGLSMLRAHQPVEIAGSLFVLVVTFVATVGWQYYREVSDKLRIKSAFQHYVTASVVNEILRDPDKLNLHGEERILTIFFSDIAGFTTMSEGLPPMQVVELLNEYLTEMTDVVFRYDGLLDKYEGDAIMAVFGAPLDQIDHAIRACRCALENQDALTRLCERWKSQGRPEFRVRIGINTGLVVVGNMGSRMRFDYTVIGDNVNLAARLESANKVFGSGILISGATNDLVGNDMLTRHLGALLATGRKQTVPVHEVLLDLHDQSRHGRIPAMQRRKLCYEECLAMAIQGGFTDAIGKLEAYLSAEQPDDEPAKRLLERCRALKDSGAKSWDGTWIQEVK